MCTTHSDSHTCWSRGNPPSQPTDSGFSEIAQMPLTASEVVVVGVGGLPLHCGEVERCFMQTKLTGIVKELISCGHSDFYYRTACFRHNAKVVWGGGGGVLEVVCNITLSQSLLKTAMCIEGLCSNRAALMCQVQLATYQYLEDAFPF